jgi:2-phospho-L-lactate transferase/gluconeogenesis factor (CofD/UPF0052 family)
LRVSIFCGGRGGSRLIRELLRHPGVEINALINAYDDGLSTGGLRGFIPGMLGPSDFRKNLANFLHWHSSHQYALTRLLEFRLSGDRGQIEGWRAWAEGGDHVPAGLLPFVHELAEAAPVVRGYLAEFFRYQAAQDQPFPFADCSIGNLIFAGAYLKNDRNFNAATSELARQFQSQVRLLNVTRGENRVLVALKEDGEILESEARIVGPQSRARIVDLFLLAEPPAPAKLERLRQLSGIEEKREALRGLHRPAEISPEARAVLLESDLIIYSCGTQFSSLMPSYLTVGLGDAIAQSPARAKIFVTNIHHDHDIRDFSAHGLVTHALALLGDPGNARSTVTHVLSTRHSTQPENLLPRNGNEDGAPLPHLQWIDGDFENPAQPGTHSGYLAVGRILEIHEEALVSAEPELDIYVNLYERSLAVGQLIEEFLELPWTLHFHRVRLRFNGIEVPPLNLPPHLTIESTRRDELFSEVRELADWAGRRTSKYLATLSGDGEYRLRDILYAREILTHHAFAAVYGSRMQSRNQFLHSLDAAYGESRLLYLCSLAGGFAFSLLFFLRFGVIFSDPLTGFRLYNRGALGGVLDKLAHLRDDSASGTTRLLMQGKCEIAEVPISYRTFRGFTRVGWRLRRSFKNAWRIFF